MKYKIFKRILTFLSLFIGVCAVYGALCMFIDPTGKLLNMDSLLPYFKVLPFSSHLFNDYIFSGIALLIVNGITNLVASFFLIKNKVMGIKLSMLFGITLMLWIIIQFIIFPSNILSITYFILGAMQLIIGIITYVLYSQDNFAFNINDYQNISNNSDTLVVFFSRLGYTKKIAYEYANKNNYEILEITTNERIKGTLGFLWCGRFGMHRWGMPINGVNRNLKKYTKIVVCSPIWVFSMSAPIREFCIKYKNNIKNIEYIFTHFMKYEFEPKILDIKPTKITNICVRLGKVKKIAIKRKL